MVKVHSDRVITYELDSKISRGSLHEFISSEINPLLEDGWAVSDVRIQAPQEGLTESCRMEVILIDAATASQQVSATM